MNAPAAPSFNWSGSYFGGHAGYVRSSVDWSAALTGARYRMGRGGFSGGVHAGHNLQQGSWVYGVEADINIGDLRRSIGVAGTDVTLSAELEWFGSVRGRVGVVNDRWLVYATGGYAFGNFSNSLVSPLLLGVRGAFSEMRHGWTLGAGLEYALASNFTARVEYRYSDYGSKSYIFSGIGNPYAIDLTTQQVIVGLSYKFDTR